MILATLVLLQTTMGPIQVRLDDVHAPRTAANFVRYVRHDKFDGGSFYRVVRANNQPHNRVKIAVIQGGPAPHAVAYPPIAMESTRVTGLHHLDGTISMARDGPNSAQGDFFICIGPQPELDAGGRRNPDGRGFAAFGRVVAGMNVVRAIDALPAHGQTLVHPVTIRFARVLPASARETSRDGTSSTLRTSRRPPTRTEARTALVRPRRLHRADPARPRAG